MSSRAHLAYARQRARKRFGNEACAECQQCDELALQEFEGRTLCRRCTLLAQGLAPTEDDHPFGKRNSAETRAMDANHHALVTALQGYWPTATQRNKHGSRKVKLAAGLRRLNNLRALEREQSDRVTLEIENMIQCLEEQDTESDAPMDDSK